MKLLVPLDFSDVSLKALDYAVLLARKMEASLILFHAVPVHSVWLDDIDEELMNEASAQLENLRTKILQQGINEQHVSIKVINQFPLDTVINDLVENEGIKYIVMGTNGASGLKMHLLGSFTSGMIQASSVPVIAVPDEASMLEPKHIVYATDLDNVDNELQELLQFAAFFDAHIQVLHFEKAENKILHREKLLASLKKTSAYTNLSLSAVPSDDIEECISCFLAEENANMLAMFSNHRNFFARLFRSSYTTDMACSIEIPLFAGKK